MNCRELASCATFFSSSKNILVPPHFFKWSLKTVRHWSGFLDLVIFEGPFVSWTYWATAASGGMPWNWNSLGRSYWNWCIESYLGSRPDWMEWEMMDFAGKWWRDFPLDLAWVWCSFCLDEKRLPLLEYNEDHFSGLGGRYFAVKTAVRSFDASDACYCTSTAIVRQISIARRKHSSTFAPFFMCFSILQAPPIHGSKMVFVMNSLNCNRCQLRFVLHLLSSCEIFEKKLHCFCCKCAVNFMNSIWFQVSFFSIHINS